MKHELKEYIGSLIMPDLPKGSDLLAEGREIGKELQPGKCRFLRESGYNNWNEYKMECTKKGITLWQLVVGRANNQEQHEAIKELYEFTQRLGIECHSANIIPSIECGLPMDCRGANIGSTSFVFNSIDDYLDHVEAAPIFSMFGDHHLGCPNSIATTTSAIKAGNTEIGIFSQYLWSRQGFSDDVQHIADVIRSCGIMSVFHDKYYTIDTYPEDSFGGYFLDCVSIIAYSLLEHYVLRDLCGCRSVITIGGLLSEIPTRIAVGVALHKLLSTEDQLAFRFWNSSTTDQWDHDLTANYALMDTEALAQCLANWHYGIGGIVTPNAITEKVRVAKFEEQLDVLVSCFRCEEKARELLPFINWKPMDEMVDEMITQAKNMLHNIFEGFEAAGVDINDPMQIMMVLKKFNPGKFEAAFHPTTYNEDTNEISAFYPTVLGRQTMKLSEDTIAALNAEGKGNCLQGRHVVIGSGDGHTYAVYLMDSVMSAAGAKVTNGGVDLTPADFLDLADEEDVKDICISVHNGQCYDFAKQCVELAKRRGREYNFLMGGQLNAILPGNSTPVDMRDRLKELGIQTCDNILASVEYLC